MKSQSNLTLLERQVIFSLVVGIVLLWGSFPGVMETAPGIIKNSLFQLLLAAPVQFFAGAAFYRATIPALKQRTATMDTLVAFGTTIAFAYSAFVTLFPHIVAMIGVEPEPYFEVSVIIIGLILLGRYFEAKAKSYASSVIKKLIGLKAKTAVVIRDNQQMTIPVEDVVVGDVMLVKAGEKIPVDGIVIEGESSVDESMVTGESIPVDKTVNAPVIGSTINKSGRFTMRAVKVGSETMLAQIITMVERAQASRAPIQRGADQVSAYFVPIVIMLAIATFVTWYVAGPSPALLYALLNMIAVLIIACPYAMGLATPTVIMVGTGLAAERGILIKDAESLEKAEKVTAVVFDKTGTVTKGKLEVINIAKTGEQNLDTRTLLELVASAESRSEHPLAQAIVQKAIKEDIKISKPKLFTSIAGFGITARVSNFDVVVGNKKLLEEKAVALNKATERIVDTFSQEGKTPVLVAINGSTAGVLALSDVLREYANETVRELTARGYEVWMITGDHKNTAKAIAYQLGISNVLAEVLPQEKAEKIRMLQEQGKSVAMVGDGVNDAPALAAANVGIALGSGSDVAIEAADITLINKDVRAVVTAFLLSKKTMRTIKLNLFWAFGYNAILIPLAMGVLYPVWQILFNPILASIAMALSSIAVVLNALLLKRAKI